MAGARLPAWAMKALGDGDRDSPKIQIGDVSDVSKNIRKLIKHNYRIL